MDAIFKEYGGIIIALVTIVALIAIITALTKADSSGVVYQAFSQVLDKLKSMGGLTT